MPEVRSLEAYEAAAQALDAHPCVRATDVTARLGEPDQLLVEVVHHINNIPWDNRPVNLEPMDSDEHSRYHRRRALE